MTRSWKKYLTRKAVQDPIHDEVMRKRPDKQGRSGYKGPSRLAPASTLPCILPPFLPPFTSQEAEMSHRGSASPRRTLQGRSNSPVQPRRRENTRATLVLTACSEDDHQEARASLISSRHSRELLNEMHHLRGNPRDSLWTGSLTRWVKKERSRGTTRAGGMFTHGEASTARRLARPSGKARGDCLRCFWATAPADALRQGAGDPDGTWFTQHLPYTHHQQAGRGDEGPGQMRRVVLLPWTSVPCQVLLKPRQKERDVTTSMQVFFLSSQMTLIWVSKNHIICIRFSNFNESPGAIDKLP